MQPPSSSRIYTWCLPCTTDTGTNSCLIAENRDLNWNPQWTGPTNVTHSCAWIVFVSELKSEQTQWNVQSLSNCSLCNQEYSHVPPKISTRLTQAALPELLSTISTDVVVPTGKLIAGKPTTMPSCPQSSLTRSHWIQYCKQFTPINSLSPQPHSCQCISLPAQEFQLTVQNCIATNANRWEKNSACQPRTLFAFSWRWCLEKNYWENSESALSAAVDDANHFSP